MPAEDNPQQSRELRPRWLRSWLQQISSQRTNRSSMHDHDEQANIRACVLALPAQLDGASLPNGVVELLIEDFEKPAGVLFDINDGRISPVAPGGAVPWACIAGSHAHWALALGPQHNISALRLTGDTQLAQRVLSGLPGTPATTPTGACDGLIRH